MGAVGAGHKNALCVFWVLEHQQSLWLLRRSFFQIMEEASLMGNLVRVSNYMLTSALAQHAMDMSSELLNSLQHDGSKQVTNSLNYRV